ncbi:GTP 3',8-cyclase MoaA [Magnetovibrio sp. PR-2]|uniref:GTP 3',8-cyclase MoaA n=1 Tax=Magnetovibrio sp. PR-2 TaxID=3120356 RepID=UPI002FCE44C1
MNILTHGARKAAKQNAEPLVDTIGRTITYLRVSVTDRCDLRCQYCMPKDMSFVPRSEVLDLEELEQICGAFVHLGVRKIRLTGGEPLVRRNVMSFIQGMSCHLGSGGLDEICLTTNGTQLAKHADALHRNGVRRINVSLDTLDPSDYEMMTRGGKLKDVLGGLAAARESGLQVKLNCVALKGFNDTHFDSMVDWCGEQGFDLTFIESMPMGDIGKCRMMSYLPLSEVREQLSQNWTLDDINHSTGGPSKYVRVAETGRKVGFISPLSKSFCEGCNRVRLTCIGQLYMCLGQGESVDLRAAVREGRCIEEAIREGINAKPIGHDFSYDFSSREEQGKMDRCMSVTGG